MDGVFEDVGTIEEIVQPKQPCTQTHALNYKLNWMGQNVLRAEVLGNAGWEVALDVGWKAGSANNALKHFCLMGGFFCTSVS
jgi:hypothetical protein